MGSISRVCLVRMPELKLGGIVFDEKPEPVHRSQWWSLITGSYIRSDVPQLYPLFHHESKVTWARTIMLISCSHKSLVVQRILHCYIATADPTTPEQAEAWWMLTRYSTRCQIKVKLKQSLSLTAQVRHLPPRIDVYACCQMNRPVVVAHVPLVVNAMSRFLANTLRTSCALSYCGAFLTSHRVGHS
jgi:hypothetical protein